MPSVIQPMLATLVDDPFDDPEWFFETKWDGVRCICYIQDGRVRLVSRNEKEMTHRYPELQGLAKLVRAENAILDGEIVVFDSKRQPSFQLLQSRLGLTDTAEIDQLAGRYPVTFCVFDLLYFNTFDLMAGELRHRKALLTGICSKGSPTLWVSRHVVATGRAAFKAAQQKHLEGVIAKHQRSTYVERRSDRWLKIKTVLRQEIVIAGFTDPRKTRKYFGALVVGLYDNGKLRYVGHVGGGFNSKSLKDLYSRMNPLQRSRSPFDEQVRTNEPVHWIEPVLVGEVKFAEWTSDNRMRQPIFMALRDDKDAKECTYEFTKETVEQVHKKDKKMSHRPSRPSRSSGAERRAPARATVDATVDAAVEATAFFRNKQLSGNASVKFGRNVLALSHLDKPYWPDQGFTKGDMLRYYFEVAGVMLPYTTDRPSILKRYPNGINEISFFQHDVDNAPPFVETVELEAENGRKIDYVLVSNPETLIYTANIGTVAQNPWNSRVGNLDRPDWIVFDLDPKMTAFSVVREVALGVKDVLDDLGLASFPKTSGSTGIHVYVPVKPVYSYELIQSFAARVAARVVEEYPEIATMQRSLSARQKDKVYVDHLQNARGKSVVAPYSVRARSGATVSAPLDWKEVKKDIVIEDFTIKNMPARIARKGDVFRDVLRKHQSLERAMKRLDMEKPAKH